MTTGTLEQAPEYLTTGDVARRYGVTLETVGRWQTEGVCAPGGVRVRLRHIKIGGHRKTTWDWVAEFIRACEGTGEPVSPLGEPRRRGSPAMVDRKAQQDQERLADRLKPRKRGAGS